MKKYIEQLLADLAAAEKTVPSPPNYKALYPDHPAHDYGLEHIVAWECTPFQPMSELFGIAADAFPPADKLTDRQVAALTKGILSLWLAFGTGVDIPKRTPKRTLYNVITDAWRNEPMQYIPNDGGFSTFEFCSLEPETCKWGASCSCIEKAKEWQLDYEDYKRRLDAGEIEDIELYTPPPFDSNKVYKEWEEGDLPF